MIDVFVTYTAQLESRSRRDMYLFLKPKFESVFEKFVKPAGGTLDFKIIIPSGKCIAGRVPEGKMEELRQELAQLNMKLERWDELRKPAKR